MMRYFKKFDIFKLLLENNEEEIDEQNPQKTNTSNKKDEKEEDAAFDEKEEEKEVPNPNEKGSVELLNKQLNKWNLEYSQAFKFLNDRPKGSEISKNKVDGQFQKLVDVIADKYKDKVRNSVKDIVSILNNPK